MLISKKKLKQLKEAVSSAPQAQKMRIVFYKKDDPSFIWAIGEFEISSMFRKSGDVRKHIADFINEQGDKTTMTVEAVGVSCI